MRWLVFRWRNRFDFGVMCLSLIPLVVRLAGEVFEDVSFLQSDLWVPAALMMPALRLFSGIEKIRVLWFSLLVILPRYQNIFVLLFLGMYQFACIGCWMLAGRFRYLAGNTWSWEPQANFNSMLDAIATLFQLFIGESWYKVKDAAHETNGGFIMLYFLAFCLFFTVLFANVIVGVVLSSFGVIDHLQEVEADGHKLNVREFEEVTQGHVKEFEEMRLRINFKSRASHVLPLCVDRCVWTVCVDCGVCWCSESNGHKLLYIRPSANTLFDGMDGGALPLLPCALGTRMPTGDCLLRSQRQDLEGRGCEANGREGCRRAVQTGRCAALATAARPHVCPARTYTLAFQITTATAS